MTTCPCFHSFDKASGRPPCLSKWYIYKRHKVLCLYQMDAVYCLNGEPFLSIGRDFSLLWYIISLYLHNEESDVIFLVSLEKAWLESSFWKVLVGNIPECWDWKRKSNRILELLEILSQIIQHYFVIFIAVFPGCTPLLGPLSNCYIDG